MDKIIQLAGIVLFFAQLEQLEDILSKKFA